MTPAPLIEKIEHFRQAVHGHENSCILIGGAACSLWYADKEPSFHATGDLDIVLVVEALSEEFVESFHTYIIQSGYAVREKTLPDNTSRRIMYRFSNPADTRVPSQLELLSKKGELLRLEKNQKICPVKIDDIYTGLSCIMMDDAYYQFLLGGRSVKNGIPCALPSTLIILKIKAVLNLLHQYETRGNSPQGSNESITNIRKHRNDVFLLLIGLSGEDCISLPDSIASDVLEFKDRLPANSPDWQGILAHLQKMRKIILSPADLTDLLDQVFHLNE
ncbi:hypothetical protein [Akkermansia massiliensis]|mgnify:CR=1 FL=1|uniref:hypothetical protein n=1 Tax=Akkermansia massiliensis TaxID=2927224 RepID=UPI002030A7DF|nr:hypothetical protein [Akkermansia sp. B2-R-115]MCM0685659.1 hypothetical protein [Akkermansia sp. B2-R-115]